MQDAEIRLLKPDHSSSASENLEALVGHLAELTSDRRDMDDDQITTWAHSYHDSLMGAGRATLDDVFTAAGRWLEESRWFPTISDLAPLVDAIAAPRREAEAAAAAQAKARPAPALDGEPDYSHVKTADLPPGYDYSQDPHWQHGLDLMLGRVEATGPLADGLGAMLVKIDERRQGFQGASKARDTSCPACRGARYVRTGGWDPAQGLMGTGESKYIRCPVCCPGGIYDAAAERKAAIEHARHRAAVANQEAVT